VLVAQEQAAALAAENAETAARFVATANFRHHRLRAAPRGSQWRLPRASSGFPMSGAAPTRAELPATPRAAWTCSGLTQYAWGQAGVSPPALLGLAVR